MCVIKRILTVALCMVLAFALSGCGNGLKNGELIIENGATEMNMAVFDVDTLNPLKTKSQSVAEMLTLIYEPLFAFDENLNSVPCLAESVSFSADGMTARVKLASDVKWQSGADFTAWDVIYTINEIKSCDSIYRHNAEPVSAAEADTDGTLILTLAEPTMNLEGLLSFPVMRNGSAETADEMPDGTGAFSVADKTASAIHLTANKYKKTSSVAAVNVHIMRSEGACLNAFEANDIDVITSAAVDLGESTPAGETAIHRYTSNRMTFLGFNCTLEKYREPYLRLALGKMIDRDRLVEKALFGKAEICRLPFNPHSSIYNETDGPEIDISGTMQKAGYTKRDGKYVSETGEQAAVDILVSVEDGRKVSVAQMLAEQLKTEGIAAAVSVVSFDEFSERIAAKKYDLFVGEVTMRDNLCPDFLTDEGNFFGYSDAEMSEAVYALKTQKGDAFKDAMLAYERVFTVNPPLAPLYFAYDGVVYKKSISGITEPNFYNNLYGLEKIYFTAVR